MSENAGFEVRAILVPRRARVSRVALLLPVVVLLALVWAGASGRRADEAITTTPELAAAAPSSSPVEPSASPSARVATAEFPSMVVGLHVQRLNDVQPRDLGPDDSVALVGWYATTAITDCPPLAVTYRDGARPGVEGDTDSWAFCERKGLLYAWPPGINYSPRASGSLALVATTVAITVVLPSELEVIGASPTLVVVVGHFVSHDEACGAATDCPPALIVDHIAWTPPT